MEVLDGNDKEHIVNQTWAGTQDRRRKVLIPLSRPHGTGQELLVELLPSDMPILVFGTFWSHSHSKHPSTLYTLSTLLLSCHGVPTPLSCLLGFIFALWPTRA